jgi:hypothetical protein
MLKSHLSVCLCVSSPVPRDINESQYWRGRCQYKMFMGKCNSDAYSRLYLLPYIRSKWNSLEFSLSLSKKKTPINIHSIMNTV